jgi:hypothetical protein
MGETHIIYQVGERSLMSCVEPATPALFLVDLLPRSYTRAQYAALTTPRSFANVIELLCQRGGIHEAARLYRGTRRRRCRVGTRGAR